MRVGVCLWLLVAFVQSTVGADCTSCTHVITAATTGTYQTVDNAVLMLAPGSTVCFDAAQSYVKGMFIKNFQGTPTQPFLFTNCGGRVTYQPDQQQHCLLFEGNKHIKVSGAGDHPTNTYGLYLNQCSFGVAFRGGTSDCELEYVEIANNVGHAAVAAKSDPRDPGNHATLYPQYYRSVFLMDNVHIHHNYLHDIATEALYIGYFDYELVLSDGGRPHEIHNLHVHHNVMERTGWDAAQFSCANDATNRIHDNTVRDYATVGKQYQDTGMIFQGGFKGDIYNNHISTSLTSSGIGMLYQGNFDSKIYNNVIYHPTGTAFSCSVNSPRTNVGTFLTLAHNTVLGAGARGLNVFIPNLMITVTSLNNVVLMSGTEQWQCGPSSNSDLCQMGGPTIPSTWMFNNVATNDFRLKSGSILRGTGEAITEFFQDADGVNRNAGSPDLGAYAFQQSPTGAPTTATPSSAAPTQSPTQQPTVTPGSPTRSPTTKTPSSAPTIAQANSPTPQPTPASSSAAAWINTTAANAVIVVLVLLFPI